MERPAGDRYRNLYLAQRSGAHFRRIRAGERWSAQRLDGTWNGTRAGDFAPACASSRRGVLCGDPARKGLDVYDLATGEPCRHSARADRTTTVTAPRNGVT